MSTDLLIEIPVANPVKMIRDGIDASQLANFDQRRYSEQKHATVDQRVYYYMMNTGDPLMLQVYTNFPLIRAFMIDCDEEQLGGIILPTLIKQYVNLKYYSTAKFSSIDGKLFIYFDVAQEFTDPAWTVPGAVTNLDGALPAIKAKAGDVIIFNLDGTDVISTINSVVWNPTLLAQGYLIDLPYTLLSPVDGYVNITYNQKETNLYGLNVVAIGTELQFVRFEMGISDYTLMSFTSEVLDVQTNHEDTLLLQYRHSGEFSRIDKWNYIYPDGFYLGLRMPANFYRFVIAGEIDVDTNDTAVPRVLRAAPYRQLIFTALNIPSWIADKIQVIMSHDTKLLCGYLWEVENYGTFELIAQVDIGTLEINLRQKNDRTKFVNALPITLFASFTPATDSIVEGGETKNFLFSTNTGASYTLTDLPSWIHILSASPFSNGATVQLQFDANPDPVVRTMLLHAAPTGGPFNIVATLDIDQDANSTIPLFIDANPKTWNINGANGSGVSIVVAASGPWSWTNFSGFAWSVDTITPTGLRIFAPSENSSGVARVGVIRLTLDANPTLLVDITIQQLPFKAMQNISPGLISIGPGGGSQVFGITVFGSEAWQATSPASGPPATGFNDWLHFDKSVHNGSDFAYNVIIDAKPPYIAPRSAIITFFRVSNPADYVTATINQTS